MYAALISKTVLFQTIQFTMSTLFSSIWAIDRTLSVATTQGLSGSGSDGNEEILHIPKISSITGASPSDCLGSYRGHLLGESYLSAEMQLEYSAGPLSVEFSFQLYYIYIYSDWNFYIFFTFIY